MYNLWIAKFGAGLGKRVVMLTGETGADLKLLAKVVVLTSLTCIALLYYGHMLLCTN